MSNSIKAKHVGIILSESKHGIDEVVDDIVLAVEDYSVISVWVSGGPSLETREKVVLELEPVDLNFDVGIGEVEDRETWVVHVNRAD